MKTKWMVISSIIVILTILPLGAIHAQGPSGPEEPGYLPGMSEPAPMGGAAIEATSATTYAYSGGPAYDSGWISIDPGEAETLTHNLGGDVDDYVVDMQYWTSSGNNGVNLRYCGGADFGAKSFGGSAENERVGAYWRSLTTSTITVYRRPEDIYAERVRIRIWVDAYPDYDSGWISLTPGATGTTLNHNLGGNVDDYVVYMEYRNSDSGVNQRYYGGADFGALAFNGTREDDRVGVYWRSLNTTSITLFRRAEDDYAEQVRVRIWVRPNPTYDSGWVSLGTDQVKTLYHNIGGDPDDYVVYMEYWSGGSGINQRYFGGMDFGAHPPSGMNEDDRVGAYWRSLDNSSITVYRRPEDVYAEQVRIRIWRYWTPTYPDYDSGWVSIGKNEAKTITHDLGGDTDDYLVDMQYRMSGNNGVNLRYYGGADFGAKSFGGSAENERVGAYWRSLTSSTITVYRRPEDIYAEQVRVRIWKMPQPDYDSGWVSLAQDTSTTLNHNLGGSIGDYLVDLQYRNTGSGVNQRYYGGADFGAHPPSGMNEDDRVGAYWRSLDNSSITVYRRPEDIYAEQVRVRIWRMAAPDYDSDWTLIGRDVSQTFTHNLGGNPYDYLVVMWQFSASNGVNQRHYGGADFGANPPAGYNADDRVGTYWRSLTSSSITVYRRPEDGFADYVEVRIWRLPSRVFLPLVLRGH